MKKQLLELFTLAAIIVGCITPALNAHADSGTITTSAPLTHQNNIYFGTRPIILTSDIVSTFTAEMNYTHKTDTSISLQYDINGNWRPVFECDFNNGEVLEINSENDTVTNNGGALVMTAASDGVNWMQTTPLADNLHDFDMTFDISYSHMWSKASIRARGEWLCLHMMEYRAAGDTDNYLMLEDRYNGKKMYSTVNVSGKRVRFRAVDDSVQVYADGQLLINYTYPTGKPIPSGHLIIGNTNAPITYDNIVINTLPEEMSEIYYQINIGKTSTLSRYTDSTAEIIAEGDGLSDEKEYNIMLKRKQGTVELTADGVTLLYCNIPAAAADPMPMECGYIGMLSSTSDNTARDVCIYNSTNLNKTDDYVEILPIQTEIDPSLSILNQTGTSDDAAITFANDKTVSITSPSTLNSRVYTTGFLNTPASDIYIKFDIKNSRPDYTHDYFYFAGYTIDCGAENKNNASPCKAYDPDGNSISCNETYNYYAHSTYTLEFIRKGYYTAVYYYPKNTERTLLFTDIHYTQNIVNFSMQKKQGAATISNFMVYDCFTDNTLRPIGVKEGSGYKRVGQYICRIPAGTTLTEFKKNMLYSDAISVSKNGRTLNDNDILTTGATITYEGYMFEWTVSILGDLNGDSDIDISDIYLARICTEKSEFNTLHFLCSDIDGDNAVTDADIDILHTAALGGEGILYEQPEVAPEAQANGSDRMIAEAGDTVKINVDLRNFASLSADISAMQIALRWQGENAEFIQDSFKEYMRPTDADIYIYGKSGGFNILYEAQSPQDSWAMSKTNIFSIELQVPQTVSGATVDFKITELTIILEDGTSLGLICGKTARFDVIEVGFNKAEKADTPILTHRDENSFTVYDTKGYEYSLDGIEWTNVPRFKNLATGTVYTVYQRISATENKYEGGISEPLDVTLYPQGDIDNDNTRDALDLSILKQLLLGYNPVADLFAADANLDEDINILDLIRLEKLIAYPDLCYDTNIRDQIFIE